MLVVVVVVESGFDRRGFLCDYFVLFRFIVAVVVVVVVVVAVVVIVVVVAIVVELFSVEDFRQWGVVVF